MRSTTWMIHGGSGIMSVVFYSYNRKKYNVLSPFSILERISLIEDISSSVAFLI